MSTAWTANRGRGSERLIRLMVWLILRLGRRATLPLLHPISAYFVLFSARSRRASRTYLTRLHGRPATLADVYRHHFTFAVTLLDRVLLLSDRCNGITVDWSIDPAAGELLESTPCVLLGAHVGSFEVLRYLAARAPGVRVRPLMYRRQRQTADRVLEDLNPAVWSEVIPLGAPGSLMRAAEAMREGASIAILGDRQIEDGSARPCTFLGGTLNLPEGPLRMAHALRTPVLVCFGLYRGNGRYTIRLEHFAGHLDLSGARRDAALAEWTQRFADRLAATCRDAPYNWFNFYDVWTDAAPTPEDAGDGAAAAPVAAGHRR